MVELERRKLDHLAISSQTDLAYLVRQRQATLASLLALPQPVVPVMRQLKKKLSAIMYSANANEFETNLRCRMRHGQLSWLACQQQQHPGTP